MGKAPEYSSEEVVQIRSSLHDELFISIVRLAKTEKNSIVYTEFECNEVINDNYRHYALANGVLGISNLPRVLRLNEDRAKIDIESIKNVLYEDVFKATQLWHVNT